MTYGDSTRVVHAGLPPTTPGQPILPGPSLASTFPLDPSGPIAGHDTYGRTDSASRRRLEQAIGELEGGDCLVFATGMAAVSAALLTLVRDGDHIMLPADGYFLTRNWANQALAPRGVRITLVPTAGPYPDFDGVRLVLLESPANPGLDVCDIAALAAAGHAAGALVAVDNTTATPLGQRPLELGADLTLASDTKALAGHDDVVLGHVTTRDPGLADRLRELRTRGGAGPGPMEAWLAHRGLATLDLRLARQAANAAALVDVLRAHPAVAAVRWPGHPDDPAHAIASRQMRRWNGILRFTLPSVDAVGRFLAASRFTDSVTSFGGLRSSADRRARWGDAVPPGFLRLSVGCEDAGDLVADVGAALDAALETC